MTHCKAHLRHLIAGPHGMEPEECGEVAALRARVVALEEQLKSAYSLHENLHNLLLVSDSALPLGSFAFSAGLESFLAHQPRDGRGTRDFSKFLAYSLSSLASTSLSYVIHGHQNPDTLPDLDNDFDASTTCTVARRASVKQGRALLAVWERGLRPVAAVRASQSLGDCKAHEMLEDFAASLRSQPATGHDHASTLHDYAVNGHLAPLFGAVCRALSLSISHTVYLFLMNHAKTLLSAGIRASVLGPYQAQNILAGSELRQQISVLVKFDEKALPQTADAGQVVPMLDIWGGRHEKLYSRIFNS